MRKFSYILISSFMCLSGCIRMHDNENSNSIKEYVDDSLNLYVDVDTLQIKSIVKESKDPVLIIFTGFVLVENDVFSKRFIKYPEIRAALSKLTIIKLNVDNKTKRNPNDSSTIGRMNHHFEMRRFDNYVEPYYIFVNRNLDVVGYPMHSTSPEEMEKFLEQFN